MVQKNNEISTKAYDSYIRQLFLLRLYLQKRKNSGKPLLVNLKSPKEGNKPARVVDELDLRMEAVLEGVKLANLSVEQMNQIEEEKREIYSKFGHKKHRQASKRRV